MCSKLSMFLCQLFKVYNIFRFSDEHGFEKPNDSQALELMNRCAESVMTDFTDIVLAYGQSDEFSFVLRRETTLFSRRTR